MNALLVFLLTLLIGVVAGLRSMTAPAVVAWAAHQHWIDLHASSLRFMGSTAAVATLTILALGELAVDKLPSTPSRTTVAGFVPRVILGALCGTALAVAGSQSGVLGGVLGAVGAIVGTFGGYHARRRLVAAVGRPRLHHRNTRGRDRHRRGTSHRVEVLVVRVRAELAA